MKATITKIEGNEIEFMELGKESQEVKRLPLAEWVKPEYVKLGDAEISELDGQISFCQMSQSTPAKPGANPGTKKKWEDDMVTFETLLTKAHNLGYSFSIHTDMLQLDVEKKFALFKARVDVIGKDGNVAIFTGHGDATSENVTGEFIKPHFIRMAETRAIVRALRWYTNNGCAEEEK